MPQDLMLYGLIDRLWRQVLLGKRTRKMMSMMADDVFDNEKVNTKEE